MPCGNRMTWCQYGTASTRARTSAAVRSGMGGFYVVLLLWLVSRGSERPRPRALTPVPSPAPSQPPSPGEGNPVGAVLLVSLVLIVLAVLVVLSCFSPSSPGVGGGEGAGEEGRGDEGLGRRIGGGATRPALPSP